VSLVALEKARKLEEKARKLEEKRIKKETGSQLTETQLTGSSGVCSGVFNAAGYVDEVVFSMDEVYSKVCSKDVGEESDEECAYAPGSPTGRQGSDLLAAKRMRASSLKHSSLGAPFGSPFGSPTRSPSHLPSLGVEPPGIIPGSRGSTRVSALTGSTSLEMEKLANRQSRGIRGQKRAVTPPKASSFGERLGSVGGSDGRSDWDAWVSSRRNSSAQVEPLPPLELMTPDGMETNLEVLGEYGFDASWNEAPRPSVNADLCHGFDAAWNAMLSKWNGSQNGRYKSNNSLNNGKEGPAYESNASVPNPLSRPKSRNRNSNRNSNHNPNPDLYVGRVRRLPISRRA